MRQPIFIVAIANAGIAHGVMILVMLATPLAMVACNYPVADAATVIQWHVLGMFLPSFFSGRLVDRFGAATVGLPGPRSSASAPRSRRPASSSSISASRSPCSGSAGTSCMSPAPP